MFFPSYVKILFLGVAGGVLNVVDRVLADSRAGIAVVRPPGHHAEQVGTFLFIFLTTGMLCFYSANFASEINFIEKNISS
jgi:hypothetical protein